MWWRHSVPLSCEEIPLSKGASAQRRVAVPPGRLCFSREGSPQRILFKGAFTLTPLSPYDNPDAFGAPPLLRGNLSYFINKYRIAF